jgi:small conductance mechanosensitive channel
MEDIVPKLQTLITFYGLNIIAAVIIFIVGRWIAKAFKNLTQKVMTRHKVDPTIVSFLGNLTYVALMVFIILAAINQLGVQTTSFIAVIGAAGLAIGLAMQGSLSNFASGFLLILFRPFKVGDFIEGAGVAGVVEEIQIFVTQLKTLDNKTIIIPNSRITGDNIVNYSAKEVRRIDLVVGVSYKEDIQKVKQVLQDVLSKDGRILKDPAPTVAVLELADSSVNFAVRPWVKTDEFWDVYFDTLENVKMRLDEEGIGIPFPQRDVHIYERAV